MTVPAAVRAFSSDVDEVPGRTCPLHYRYRPEDIAAVPPAFRCETLYVVGGLYGNVPALEAVLRLFEAEPALDKRLVFNGDFHWFDTDPAAFERINVAVERFDAIRGNVETEIATADSAAGAGCGCSYPDWVDDGIVERSNRIIERLRRTARRFPPACAHLAALPMWLRVEVGGCRVGIVHGDAHSLAGWDFAPELLADSRHRQRVFADFVAAQVDAWASTHTCVPVLQTWTLAAQPASARRVLVNNGAAGMPNLAGAREGLLTRIATTPPADADQRRAGTSCGAVSIHLIAVGYDDAEWKRVFLAEWPAGSDAHRSYWQRIDGESGQQAAAVMRHDTDVDG